MADLEKCSRGESRGCKVSEVQALEPVQRHFCYLPLVKANVKDSSYSRGGKQTLPLDESSCKKSVVIFNLPQEYITYSNI